VLTVVVAHCIYEIVPTAVASRTVGGLLWLDGWWCWWGMVAVVELPFCWCCGNCSFFLVVQASVRFPNLPLVGFWSVASFSSEKGRAVVVDPVFG